MIHGTQSSQDPSQQKELTEKYFCSKFFCQLVRSTRRSAAGWLVGLVSSAVCAVGGGLNDPNLHLLVDDEEIQFSTNLLRVLNKPQKHPTAVLVADKPWEGERVQAWGNVIQEPDGLLRMWYFSLNSARNEVDRGGYAYAESRDGIHWSKPNLGVVDFRGSKQNNLFYTFSPDGKNLVAEELARHGLGLPALDEQGKEIGVLNNADGITVVRDDAEADPQRRYKLIANMQDHRMWTYYDRARYPDVTDAQVKQAQAVHGQYLDTSPDGIHWTLKPRRLLKCFGDYMMVTRDERNGQWWLNERIQGHGIRNGALRTSKDLNHWSEPKVFFEDDAENDFGRLFEWHGGMTPFNYGNINLGFLEKWCNAGFGNTCELICNREGQPWRRVSPGTPYLDIGTEGAWDRTFIYPTHNGPVRMGDKLFVYYTGAGVNENTNRAIPMAIGLATIRLDRFAGLAQFRGSRPGELLTKPLRVSGDHLELNVEPLDRARVRVALSEPGTGIIAGYRYDDSQVEVHHENAYAPVRWREKRDVSELKGRRLELRIEIRGGALYSVRFR